MVSPLTLKLMGGSGDSSNSSKATAGSSGQKRKFDQSISGYSADREDSSSMPPIVSIDVDTHSSKIRSTSNNESFAKNQKRNDLNFAASSVRADLARAGLEYSSFKPDDESNSKIGPIPISLKGVQLMRSNEFQQKTCPTRVLGTCSEHDYRSLALACFDMYPAASVTAPSAKDDDGPQDSDQSTSSVSESDTESATSNNNSCTGGSTLVIPPVFEDKDKKVSSKSSPKNVLQHCNLLSGGKNAQTMGEAMSLSQVPRLVVISCEPFSIVYANAAFYDKSGLSNETVIGSDFTSIIDGNSNAQLLSDCMFSSNDDNHQKLQFIHNQNDSSRHALQRFCKVSPIVGLKPTHDSEIMKVTHLAVELLEMSTDTTGLPLRNISDTSNLAIGVMG